MNPETAPATTSNTTSSAWPGAFGIYKVSKAFMKGHAWTIVGLYLITYVIQLGVSLLLSHNDAGRIIAQVISLIISLIFTSAYTLFVLRLVQGDALNIEQAVKQGLPFALKLFGVGILVSLALAISLLLLIVPFFFLLPRLYLAPYFAVDQNLSPPQAFDASMKQTKGHAGKVWGIIGFQFLLGLLCITVIGIPFAIYMFVMFITAPALLYMYIAKGGLPTPTAQPVAANTTA